jgi:hypothetical protein
MPWQERSIVTVRKKFVTRATQEGANIAALCPIGRRPTKQCRTNYSTFADFILPQASEICSKPAVRVKFSILVMNSGSSRFA